MTKDTLWVHGSGDTYDEHCVACTLDDDESSVAHQADWSEESTIDEPFCAICGHDIDLVMRKEGKE